MPTEAPPILWCVRLVGPDIFCAAHSHEHATALCDVLKAAIRRQRMPIGSPPVEPRVEPWPLSPEEWATARALQEQFEVTQQ